MSCWLHRSAKGDQNKVTGFTGCCTTCSTLDMSNHFPSRAELSTVQQQGNALCSSGMLWVTDCFPSGTLSLQLSNKAWCSTHTLWDAQSFTGHTRVCFPLTQRLDGKFLLAADTKVKFCHILLSLFWLLQDLCTFSYPKVHMGSLTCATVFMLLCILRESGTDQSAQTWLYSVKFQRGFKVMFRLNRRVH